MSYSYAPSRRPLYGLGLFSTLPGGDPTAAASKTLKQDAASVGNAAKAQAIAYANQQIANYPSASEVAAQYNQYAQYLKAIPGFNPEDMKDPQKAVGLLKDALINYAAANGIIVPTSTAAAKAELEDYALKIASGYTGIDLSQYKNLSVSAKGLENAAVDIACTAFVMYTGVDPSILTVTYEALKDGKLTEPECVAIGSVAGAIAGAAIGQAFGIPAPIGALIGGEVGGMVGGTIGEIIGLTGDDTAFKKQLDDMVNQEKAFEQSTLAQAQKICAPLQNAYWDSFDNLLMGMELRWEKAEVEIGWKFGLRWFGQDAYTTLGQPMSHAWVPAQQNFTGPYTAANRAEVLSKNVNYDTYSSGGALTPTATYWCPYGYGCPYPTVPNLGGGLLERDAQAFLARGALWIPSALRPAQCVFPAPSPDAWDRPIDRAAWVQTVMDQIRGEQAALGALRTLSVAVSGDLVKTAASVAAEKTINDQLSMSASQMSHADAQRTLDLSAAKKTGVQLSDLINYSALFIGLGVLGAALYKRSKS